MASSPGKESAPKALAHHHSFPCGELTVGLRSSPYLADHVVQDAAILPGALYIDAAIELGTRLAGAAPFVLRRAAFLSPVIVGEEDNRIEMRRSGTDAPRCGLIFVDSAAPANGPQASRVVASVDIDFSQQRGARTAVDGQFLAQFRLAGAPMDAATFYDTLRRNANWFGPAFQGVTAIWRTENECVATVRGRSGAGSRTCLLDSVMQLLSVFTAARKRTFMLRGVDEIQVHRADLPAAVMAHAVLSSSAADEITGDIVVFDDTGTVYLTLAGVRYTFLNGEQTSGVTFAVAANFTAEPCEEALRFWGEHFGFSVNPAFAPYNQVFQQLLDPNSLLSTNRDGVNVVLLALDEWIGGEQSAPPVDPARVNRALGASPRHRLPNGMDIAQLNEYETAYLYKEIFEDRCYMRHGIELPDGATVIDIGANIGMFSLFVTRECRDPRIIAVEPAPAVCELLRANCSAYSDNVEVVNAGAAGAPGTATFTFYEKSSVFSGFHPDAAGDGAAIQGAVQNALVQSADLDEDSAARLVPELMAGRLQSAQFECPMTTVSELIASRGLEVVDLLKIDAEKSEREILRGIGDQDWDRIRQVVLEIHDPAGDAVRYISELLQARGFDCAVHEERGLEKTGLVNLYARKRGAVGQESPLQRTAREFGTALRAFAARNPAPVVLCICPPSPAALSNQSTREELDAAERAILSATQGIPNVHPIAAGALMERYPMPDYHDAHAYKVGRVPYTAEAFAAIGTAVFRHALAGRRHPYKVVLLDCDNTLWKGVCGEAGASGVEITEAHAALQRFMVEQMNAGMLIGVCSKNHHEDVDAVFSGRAEMVLKPEHVATWRVNWKSKPENVQSIARELNVGLDSIVFVDDNPLECAEMRARCPGVVCLQLPAEPQLFRDVLEHSWVFDRAGRTNEDSARTRLYAENAEREAFREQVVSLADFISRLELNIGIAAATDADLDRVSQLTMRTNQFNLTTIRRSVSEVKECLARPGTTCLAVRVSDRFGDYGLVGVAIYETDGDRLKLDTLLLSCRVLGRGVEHALLADIGRRALETGASFVDVPYSPTEKNIPAGNFINGLGRGVAGRDGIYLRFEAKWLSALTYDPDAETESQAQTQRATTPASVGASIDFGAAFPAIAQQLRTPADIIAAIDRRRLQQMPAPAVRPPADSLQAALVTIWKRALGRTHVGVNDNFFDLGGSSLRAVQVISAIKKELGHDVSIVTLFEAPTVARLALRLRGDDAGNAAASAMERGRQRTYTARRRAV